MTMMLRKKLNFNKFLLIFLISKKLLIIFLLELNQTKIHKKLDFSKLGKQKQHNRSNNY